MSADGVNEQNKGAVPGGLWLHAVLAGVTVSLAAPLFLLSGKQTVQESVRIFGIGVLVAAILVLFRGGRLASSAAGRLACVGTILAAVLNLSPLFQRLALEKSIGGVERWILALGLLPAGLFLLLALVGPRGARASGEAVSTAEQAEAFLARCGNRFQLILLAGVVLAAGLALSGYSIRWAAPQLLVVGALILAIPTLLNASREPRVSGWLVRGALLMLLGVGGLGLWQMYSAENQRAAGVKLLAADRLEEGGAHLNAAAAANDVLQSNDLRIGIERAWAEYHERKGHLDSAMHHWQLAAMHAGQNIGENSAVQRMLIKKGDSLTGWRQLLFGGFRAVRDPERLSGFLALGESAEADLRARLMAALLSWETGAPEAETRARLEHVLKLAPRDATALNLLTRLDQGKPNAKPVNVGEPLTLPSDLIAGKTVSQHSPLGLVGELGEAATLVALEDGEWECRLRARGTPLHEEWPLLRIEFNGAEVARMQVNRAEYHEIPFRFSVKRSELFRVRLVFENQVKEYGAGLIERRGLDIASFTFQKVVQRP